MTEVPFLLELEFTEDGDGCTKGWSVLRHRPRSNGVLRGETRRIGKTENGGELSLNLYLYYSQIVVKNQL